MSLQRKLTILQSYILLSIFLQLTSNIIEANYQHYIKKNGQEYIEFSVQSQKYTLYFDDMVQVNLDTDNQRNVERRVIPLQQQAV